MCFLYYYARDLYYSTLDQGNLLEQKPYVSASKTHTKCIILAVDIYLSAGKIVYFRSILAADNLLTGVVILRRTTSPKFLNPVATEILFIA